MNNLGFWPWIARSLQHSPLISSLKWDKRQCCQTICVCDEERRTSEKLWECQGQCALQLTEQRVVHASQEPATLHNVRQNPFPEVLIFFHRQLKCVCVARKLIWLMNELCVQFNEPLKRVSWWQNWIACVGFFSIELRRTFRFNFHLFSFAWKRIN